MTLIYLFTGIVLIVTLLLIDALKASKKYEEAQIGKALVECFRRTGLRLKDFKKRYARYDSSNCN